MRRHFTKPRTDPIVLALMALVASTLLAACGGGASTPTTAPNVPMPTATSGATATAATAATPTGAPRAPASRPPLAPTTAPQNISPAATASVSAKATTAPVASVPPTAKPGATRAAGGGSLSACDVITKADVEAVLGAPVLMPPVGVPGASGPPDVTGAAEDATTTCIYVPQGKGNTGVMVSLGAPHAGDPTAGRPLTQASKGTALQPLSGIGDEAVTDGKHIVITRKNGYQLAIIVGSETIGDPSSLETGKRLAKIGADRL
jgi:hypothetical protein